MLPFASVAGILATFIVALAVCIVSLKNVYFLSKLTPNIDHLSTVYNTLLDILCEKVHESK